jgi:hypothetical protein
MPAAPSDGMVITIESTQQVTALTVQGNSGQSLVGAASQLIPNQPLSYIYRLTNTTWYPMAGGAGRATTLVSGTSQASTSGTSIDFTGIPSWAKRVTVVFSGVSTNGSSNIQAQVGSGSVTTSGYVSSAVAGQTGASVTSITSGHAINTSVTSAMVMNGSVVFTLVTGNTWVGVSVITATGLNSYANGTSTVSLSGALDRVRITTVNGTDAFDAGTINILYE